MQGIGRKPEPRSCSGMEHQCVIGLSLPSYFDCRKPVNCPRFQSLETARQGSLPLVRAASRLLATPFRAQLLRSPQDGVEKVSTRHARVRTPRAQAVTFNSAVLNLFISSCVPIVTRTCV